MAASKYTPIPLQKYLEIAAAAGLKTEEKRGWLKFYGSQGPKGPSIYVPMRAEHWRVHISRFTASGVATDPKFVPFGGVSAQLDPAGSVDQRLGDFAACCEQLLAVPPPAPRSSAPAAKKEKAPVVIDEQAHADRLAKLKAIAAEMGVLVSPRAMAQPVAMADAEPTES